MSEREFTRLVRRSLLPSLGRKLLFVFPLTNVQEKNCRRMVRQECRFLSRVEGRGYRGSRVESLERRTSECRTECREAMSDEIVTAMSTACGASIFLFELFLKKNT